MTYPGRVSHRPKAPSKAALRVDAQMVVTHRVSAGIETPPHMVASIARSHGLSVAEVEKALADAQARRAG